ncbi:MAG: multicopper oxidase family protein [Synechococcus sp.]
MDRRMFLRQSSLLAAAVALGNASLPSVKASPLSGSLSKTVSSSTSPFVDPPVRQSSDGVLDTSFDMRNTFTRIGDRQIVGATYDGCLPGPTLKIRGGDCLRLKLKNSMTPLGVPQNGPIPPSFDPSDLLLTNIHTHGLQVSPQGGGDDVFLTLKPGESHQYEYNIPYNQPAGLHWYHPHRHTSTTHQSWQGLTGAIVVEGEIDYVPEIAAARDRIMVLNGLWVNPAGEVPASVVVPNAGFSPFTSIPAVPTDMLFTINGMLQPDISIRPGEVQRWRVLAAAPHRFFRLKLEGHTLYQIGQDGIPFDTPRPMDEILLSAGNRAELLVKGGRAGTYAFKALAYDQGHPGGPRPERLLGRLVSSGQTVDGKLPTRLVKPPNIDRLPVAKRRRLDFAGDISGAPVRFTIDDKAFDPNRIDQAVELGTVEEWTLVNHDVFQHPFHIHVNPFQVVDIQGIPPGDLTWNYNPKAWWDVFRMPPKGRVTIRMYFRPDIPGKTVYHCHILPHEDNGMMGTVMLGSTA